MNNFLNQTSTGPCPISFHCDSNAIYSLSSVLLGFIFKWNQATPQEKEAAEDKVCIYHKFEYSQKNYGFMFPIEINPKSLEARVFPLLDHLERVYSGETNSICKFDSGFKRPKKIVAEEEIGYFGYFGQTCSEIIYEYINTKLGAKVNEKVRCFRLFVQHIEQLVQEALLCLIADDYGFNIEIPEEYDKAYKKLQDTEEFGELVFSSVQSTSPASPLRSPESPVSLQSCTSASVATVDENTLHDPKSRITRVKRKASGRITANATGLANHRESDTVDYWVKILKNTQKLQDAVKNFREIQTYSWQNMVYSFDNKQSIKENLESLEKFEGGDVKFYVEALKAVSCALIGKGINDGNGFLKGLDSKADYKTSQTYCNWYLLCNKIGYSVSFFKLNVDKTYMKQFGRLPVEKRDAVLGKLEIVDENENDREFIKNIENKLLNSNKEL